MSAIRPAYKLLAALIVSALTLTASAADGVEAKPGVRQPQIEQIVAQISPAHIQTYIEKLVSFKTRHTMSETQSDTVGIGAARRWIKAELEHCGQGKLDVRFDSHIHPVDRRISKPTEIVNVVATLKGTTAPERYYVVSGHYDSRVTDIMNADAFEPGANDDASGTAAVMEMACVMAQHQFDASLIFMAVAAEEQGLYGSEHFAKTARAKNMDIAGMFTNDIIGSSRADNGAIDQTHVRLFAEGVPPVAQLDEQERSLVATGGENDSPTRELARAVKAAGERYLPGFTVNIVYRRDRYLRGGDHIPFLQQGYAALRFTEPNEDFNHQHQDVRSEHGVKLGDLPEYVDYDYTAQVARINAAALASLALAPAAPSEVKVKTDQLENDTRLVWAAGSEPNLAGYRIVWRDTTAPDWQHAQYVGKVNAYTMKNLSKDNYLFGVQAVSKDGEVSPASYPLPLR